MWHIWEEKEEEKEEEKKYHYQANEITDVVTDSPKVPIIFSRKERDKLLIKPISNWKWLSSRTLEDKF